MSWLSVRQAGANRRRDGGNEGVVARKHTTPEPRTGATGVVCKLGQEGWIGEHYSPFVARKLQLPIGMRLNELARVFGRRTLGVQARFNTNSALFGPTEANSRP